MIDVLNGVSTALGITSKLSELHDKAKYADMSLLLAELSESLADVKMASVEIKAENVTLREELLKLREAAKHKEDLIFDKSINAYVDADGNGPYCPACLQGSNKDKVQMLSTTAHTPVYKCPVCGTISRPPAQPVAPRRNIPSKNHW